MALARAEVILPIEAWKDTPGNVMGPRSTIIVGTQLRYDPAERPNGGWRSVQVIGELRPGARAGTARRWVSAADFATRTRPIPAARDRTALVTEMEGGFAEGRLLAGGPFRRKGWRWLRPRNRWDRRAGR